MNRLFKISALFATLITLGLLANSAFANGQTKVTRKIGTYKISNKLQKGPGNPGSNGSPVTNPTQPSKPTQPSAPTNPIIRRFPPNTTVLGPIFNKPTTPSFPYHIPPGGWKAIGPIFNQPTKPTPTPTQPPKGTGKGHGTGYGFGGGSFGGSTVVTTTVAPVADLPAAPAPAAAATESDAADAMQVAAGSTITLKGESFGAKAGRVGVVIGGVLIPAQVTSWTENAITVTLPLVGVESTTKAAFVVQRADGSTAKEMSFELVAAK